MKATKLAIMSITDDFKNALASWATGVSVVATRHEHMVYGITVSSFSSLSLDPPLILVCLNNRTLLSPMIAAAEGFTVSILASDQASVSNHFASSGREPSPTFDPIAEQASPSGLPIIAGAAGYVDCTLYKTLVEGDHTIVIGRVVAAGADASRAPLLYHRRGYRHLADDDTGGEPDSHFETLFYSF